MKRVLAAVMAAVLLLGLSVGAAAAPGETIEKIPREDIEIDSIFLGREFAQPEKAVYTDGAVYVPISSLEDNLPAANGSDEQGRLVYPGTELFSPWVLAKILRDESLMEFQADIILGEYLTEDISIVSQGPEGLPGWYIKVSLGRDIEQEAAIEFDFTFTALENICGNGEYVLPQGGEIFGNTILLYFIDGEVTTEIPA
ncbi:hypothetical protein [Youxingia wuxianensis]|uniref:GerMN domain-containing protein n=1 Tax=Youxingia wuxianensis TaxID=2763678 RepID=A0A926IJ98_9FIRM|nr:hypothetical protein [Youxingia wuxianensis]MBC8586468.1 hypothetical protein [Youxingia wuxianensis]